MAEVFAKSLEQLLLNNASGTIPEGFMSASLTNLGSADATFTQNGKTFTLPAGAVFNFGDLEGNYYWKAVTVDATGTIVQVAYY